MTVKDHKSIVIAAAAVAVFVAAAAGAFLFWDPPGIPLTEQESDPDRGIAAIAPDRSNPDAGAPDSEAALSAPAVLSFDIVRIEPNGEGVIAGRAEPGWTVSVETEGRVIAETLADGAGEWAVFLETPLGEGEHALSLQAASPDGKRVVLAPEPIVAEVETATAPVTALAEPAPSPEPAREPVVTLEPTPQTSESEPEVLDSEISGPGRDTTHAVRIPEPGAAPEAAKSEPTVPSPPVVAAIPTAPSEQVAVSEPKAPKRADVVIKSIDYREIGTDSGKVTLGGIADAGGRIMLYLDETKLGEVEVNQQGAWRFDTETRIGPGDHRFRADSLTTTGAVASTASARMKRPAPVAVAAKEKEAASGGQAPTAGASPQALADAEGKPKVYEVRRGDSLWAIAQRYFGGGWRYKEIYKENKEQIRQPNLIFPEQKFSMPKE